MIHNIANTLSGWDVLGLVSFGIFGIILFSVLMLALVALKGYALWTAAQRNEVGWFITILILNTFGILELIYLYFIAKKWGKPMREAHHHAHHSSEPK